ncbi:hypothetical protein IFM89_009115 [Coptis chinensis]|uniref:Pentatricopeptide repeat-containing protein n=1 Tax=Coptis chinensis TaxID=261450 RepID=A0A835HSQ9_9MAGN|nr:hypothetical protein IFM89_009115 [Coptis chinensis]
MTMYKLKCNSSEDEATSALKERFAAIQELSAQGSSSERAKRGYSNKYVPSHERKKMNVDNEVHGKLKSFAVMNLKILLTFVLWVALEKKSVAFMAFACIRHAEKVFKRMVHKNIVSCTSLPVGYGQNGLSEEAMRIFCEMQRNGVEPDKFTLGSVISSCANFASLEKGAQFHSQALVLGLISFITVSNALVTLYGKCGEIEDSHKLFNEMHIKDEVSWTALVSGYAQFGKANQTIDLFERMLDNDLKPDGVTFIGVLSACSLDWSRKDSSIFNL